jgi:elongation factor Ts
MFPRTVIDREREIYKAQVLEMGKPEQMVEKIAEGKMNKFFKESCLMNQQYVKEPDKTIADYLNEVIAKPVKKLPSSDSPDSRSGRNKGGVQI